MCESWADALQWGIVALVWLVVLGLGIGLVAFVLQFLLSD